MRTLTEEPQVISLDSRRRLMLQLGKDEQYLLAQEGAVLVLSAYTGQPTEGAMLLTCDARGRLILPLGRPGYYHAWRAEDQILLEQVALYTLNEIERMRNGDMTEEMRTRIQRGSMAMSS